MSPETLKELIRSVAQEEDRRDNVIIFGVQEQEPDDLRECVKDVFDEMMVRPEIREISRVGRKSSGASTRPIKVKVSSSSTASLILGQTRRLRYSEAPGLKSVFVKLDLSKKKETSSDFLFRT